MIGEKGHIRPSHRSGDRLFELGCKVPSRSALSTQRSAFMFFLQSIFLYFHLQTFILESQRQTHLAATNSPPSAPYPEPVIGVSVKTLAIHIAFILKDLPINAK